MVLAAHLISGCRIVVMFGEHSATRHNLHKRAGNCESQVFHIAVRSLLRSPFNIRAQLRFFRVIVHFPKYHFFFHALFAGMVDGL